jgi:hypothetical protein
VVKRSRRVQQDWLISSLSKRTAITPTGDHWHHERCDGRGGRVAAGPDQFEIFGRERCNRRWAQNAIAKKDPPKMQNQLKINASCVVPYWGAAL